MDMKKILLLLTLGILTGVLLVRHHHQKKEVIHFVEDDMFDPSAKNFGEFPPDVPEKLFDNFSV
jgi:hypothetical protein